MGSRIHFDLIRALYRIPLASGETRRQGVSFLPPEIVPCMPRVMFLSFLDSYSPIVGKRPKMVWYAVHPRLRMTFLV